MRTHPAPNKSTPALPRPPFISACIVTHYDSTPYHARRMEVVQMCLDTMIAGLQGSDYELLIWDNGSTPTFRTFLRTYLPHVLIESVNVGPHNARHHLANIARGEIIAMTDDDVLFHPEWLSLQLEVLSTFPGCGIVSGSPYRPAFEWSQSGTIPDGADVARGDLIPAQWQRDAAASIGLSCADWNWNYKNIQDVLLSYQSVKAWNHAHHFQFTGKRGAVAPALFTTSKLLDDGKRFNQHVADAGYLQLCTFRRTAVHIGNVIDEGVKKIHADWWK